MAGTPSASNGGGHHHAPMVLLVPAHLQLYGVDATLSSFNQPPKTAASTDPVPPASAENPLPTTPAETPPRAARNADVPIETHDGSAQSFGPGPSGAENVPERQQQQLQRKRQQRPGFSVGSSARREKLPSAPPAMSARCQVHPALMKDLGASPGDPVLVFALAEGWVSDAKPPPPHLLAPAESGGDGAGVTAASAASNPRHTGEGPGGDVEGLAVRDRHDGDGGGSGGGRGIAVEGERSSVAPSGGGVSSGKEVPCGDGVGGGGGNTAFESCSYGAEGSVAGALVEQEPQKQHHQQQQQQMLPVSQYQGGAVLSETAGLRCLLCTVWTNPHLAPTQAAVDGRVNVPLTNSDYPPGPIRPSSGGTAAGVPAGRFGDLTGENADSTREEAVNSSAEESIASYFLRAAVFRHATALAHSMAAWGERAKRGSAVVGIIPLHSAYGGLAAAAAAGRVGRATGFCGAPPLASRVSARVLRPATRAPLKETGFGGTTAFGASARTGVLPPVPAAGPVSADDPNRRSASTTTAAGQEIPGGRENPPAIPISTEFLARRENENEDKKGAGAGAGAGAEGAERGGLLGTETWRAPPFRPLPLPPEYTSLVKRSLRHLVVSCGCEVAVPACPDSSVDEATGVSGPSDVNSGRGRGGGGRRRPADGTALLRIGPFSTAGGGGGSEMSHFGGAYLDGGSGSGVDHSTTGTSSSGSGAASAAGALLAPFHSEFSPSRPGMAGGGGGVGVRRTGALAALLRGEVCAVGPDSLVLVEAEGDTFAPDAGELQGRRVVWTPRVGSGVGDSGGGGAGDGGGGGGGMRAGANQKGESKHVGKRRERGDARKVSMSPTDALVELMLLPMTAAKPAREGSTPLEFLVPRGVLLTGPPGVGKTFAVRSAVETVRELSSERGETLFQVQLTTLNGAEILSLGQWEACEALREAFSAAENWSRDSARGRRRGFPNAIGRRCAVIFLDEADALLARRDRDGDKAGGGDGARALAQLLTLMDGFHKAEGSHVLVFGATNRPGDLDPALRRPGRFDRELALPPPDLQARADILRHHLKGVKVVGGEGVINAVALKCVGYVGADLAALARQAVLLAARKQGVLLAQSGNTSEAFCPPRGGASRAEEGEPVVGADVLAAAMEKVGASSLRGHHVTVPDTPWSDIGGMEKAKAKLRQAVEWPVANKEAFDRMGLTPPRGILLFGPPGCSKTTLVRAAATAAGATFVCLSGADVFSPYLGEAEAAVRQAFVLARNAAPALLFFDEIDAIVCKREGGGGKGSSNSAESRVLATFLTEMDGVGSLRGDNVIVVGATNRPEAVDRALLRPGRFDQVVYAPLPAEDARRQIFEVHTRRMTIDRENVDFRKLAKVSEGLTGAEIEGVCREAAMSSIREAGFGGDGACGASSPGGLGGYKQATVTMRNLLAAATASAARPGVTKEMIEGYDRFASGL